MALAGEHVTWSCRPPLEASSRVRGLLGRNTPRTRLSPSREGEEEKPPDDVQGVSLGTDGGGEADAATEQRRHEADCPLPGRAWREPRAKGAGPKRRLGETRRTSFDWRPS